MPVWGGFRNSKITQGSGRPTRNHPFCSICRLWPVADARGPSPIPGAFLFVAFDFCAGRKVPPLSPGKWAVLGAGVQTCENSWIRGSWPQACWRVACPDCCCWPGWSSNLSAVICGFPRHTMQCSAATTNVHIGFLRSSDLHLCRLRLPLCSLMCLCCCAYPV